MPIAPPWITARMMKNSLHTCCSCPRDAYGLLAPRDRRARGRPMTQDDPTSCLRTAGSGLYLTLLLSLLYLFYFAFPGLCMPAVLETATNEEPIMRKRKASLNPSSERPALPLSPAQSRSLVRPNC
jgi:hypothetical protein